MKDIPVLQHEAEQLLKGDWSKKFLHAVLIKYFYITK